MNVLRISHICVCLPSNVQNGYLRSCSTSNEKRLQDPFEKKLQKTFPLGSEVALTIFMLAGLSLEGYVMELSNLEGTL